jgi:vitamin B12/bleomycin/antimicrobial peptide transport system ATP-binding/permease protein
MKRLARLIANVWHLAKGYWSSEERLSAWLLLAAIIGFNLGLVFVNVLLNDANGAIFNALQNKDQSGFYRSFGYLMILIMFYLAVYVLRYFLNQMLQIRWRRWLTDQYLTRWLSHRSFYRMRFIGGVDNPDQRISEDVRLFVQNTLSLGLGLLSAVVTLVSFAGILWRLSGSFTIPIGEM